MKTTSNTGSSDLGGIALGGAAALLALLLSCAATHVAAHHEVMSDTLRRATQRNLQTPQAAQSVSRYVGMLPLAQGEAFGMQTR